jgi:RNA polymerase sigma-70 factor (ECF subfamily)
MEQVGVREMVYEYRRSIRMIKKAYGSAEGDEKTVINGMINDMQYAINWMHHGRNPDNRRGADRTEVYLTDPELMDVCYFDKTVTNESEFFDEDRQTILNALRELTEREEDIYLMHHAEMLSMEEIADLMKIKKATVQTTCRRAQNKIEKSLKRGMIKR